MVSEVAGLKLAGPMLTEQVEGQLVASATATPPALRTTRPALSTGAYILIGSNRAEVGRIWAPGAYLLAWSHGLLSRAKCVSNPGSLTKFLTSATRSGTNT